MSTIYNTEPQPTGSVILHTTSGDLSVELFAKQTPLTCRNFLQHCLDGYYDNTIFHRLVPGFILQGGDPTGTGNGGESIYDGGAFGGDLDPWPMDQRRGKNAGPTGANFKDEFHSRLKFNRRGLLGMANDGTIDSNGSQFFFTLGKTPELDGKNTLFGRIAGDTIYNLAKMGEAEIEEGGDRPLYPTKITSTEILVNPFSDMKKRERFAQRVEKAHTVEKRPKKRKPGKQLLSFGDEEGDDEPPIIKKAKFDTRIVMDDAAGEDGLQSKSSTGLAKRDGKAVKKAVPIREPPVKPQARSPSPESQPALPKREAPKAPDMDDASSSEPEVPKKKSALDKTNEEIAALKASMKRTIHMEPARETKSAIEQLMPETSRRGRKRRPGGNGEEDPKALNLLKAFQARLDHAPPEKGASRPAVNQDGEEDKQVEGGEEDDVCDLHFVANCQSCKAWDKYEEKEESEDEGWMSHSLSFAADKLGKDLSYRKKAEEELIVIDPREKSQTLKEAKRAEREARSGGSGRAWDQARFAKLSMASATAGRGAK